MSQTQQPIAALQQILTYQNAGFQWPPLPWQIVSYLRAKPCTVLAQIGPKWYVVPLDAEAAAQYPIECELADLAPVKSAACGWVPFRFWNPFMAPRRPAGEKYELKLSAIPNVPGPTWPDVEAEPSRRYGFRFLIKGTIPIGGTNGDFCVRPVR